MPEANRSAPPGQPDGVLPLSWPPEDFDAAWERVLDCGAPGPARAEPALFYQGSRRPAKAYQDLEEEADHARAS